MLKTFHNTIKFSFKMMTESIKTVVETLFKINIKNAFDKMEPIL